MKNWVLVSVGWPAQQMGCWSTTDWEAKNTSCMVQRKVKNAIESHPLKKKNRSWCASSVVPPAPSLIQFARGSSWYHCFPEGKQVSARPRFCILTCIAHDIRRQWFQLIFWGPYRPMGFFLKIGSPIYFLTTYIYLYYYYYCIFYRDLYIHYKNIPRVINL